MKAAYLLDQDLNYPAAPAEYKAVAKMVLDGAGKVNWIVPKGAVVEGDEALYRVSTGQAAPVDEECAVACGLTPSELIVEQRKYLMAMAGVHIKEHCELFMAEVIDGYDVGTTETKTVFKPGKNWDAYQALLKKSKAEDE